MTPMRLVRVQEHDGNTIDLQAAYVTSVQRVVYTNGDGKVEHLLKLCTLDGEIHRFKFDTAEALDASHARVLTAINNAIENHARGEL